MAYIYIIPQSC